VSDRPVVAVTMGDPAGIGAEIAVRALMLPEIHSLLKPIIVGDIDYVADAVRIIGEDIILNRVSSVSEALFRFGHVDVMDLDNIALRDVEYGKVSAKAGHAAYQFVERGIHLAMAKEADAVVTGPIHKASLNLGGHHYSGHTEIFAELTGATDYAMMLADGDFRVAHVTTHISLRQACNLVSRRRVFVVIKLTYDALKRLGIPDPLIGVAGLNPHSGEGGLFGTEEIDEIAPAIDDARAIGVRVDGPVPPDTLFAKTRGGQYDAAIAMYHDQGHIAMKTAGFSLDAATGKWTAVSGVNITLGLPIIRVSVDHGTAFGKAGQGRANPESMVQALKVAAQLASSSDAAGDPSTKLKRADEAI
jgi:4-hydroxythreonine-4-phosphate dehydrogenase